MRDYQKGRLYEAENVAYAEGRELSLTECETYARRVLRSRWTRNRYPFAEKHIAVIVVAPRGKTSWTDRRTSIIYLAPWSRTKFFILHEVSHLLVSARVPFHGREFAGVFLKMVKYWLGMRAWKRLKASFDKRDVDYKEVA